MSSWICLLLAQVCDIVIGDGYRLDHGYRDLEIQPYVLCMSYWNFIVVCSDVCMLRVMDVIDEVPMQVFMKIR